MVAGVQEHRPWRAGGSDGPVGSTAWYSMESSEWLCQAKQRQPQSINPGDLVSTALASSSRTRVQESTLQWRRPL